MKKRTDAKHVLKAVIFDMDGVIVDSEPVYFEIESKSFQTFGVAVSEEEHHSYVGITLNDMWDKIFCKHNPAATAGEMTQYHKRQVIEYMSSLNFISPIANFVDLVKELKILNVKIAVASSSPRELIDIILHKSGTTALFDCIVSGDYVYKGKPAPDIFIKATEVLGLCPEECIVFEDSFNGIKASKAARITCVGFQNPNSGKQDLSSANLVISTYSDMSFERLKDLLTKQ